MTHPPLLPIAPDGGLPAPCPHFGPCGGCQLQHLDYPAQLALKLRSLRDLLTAAAIPLPGSPDSPVSEDILIHAASPWAYRNRIRLRFAPDPATGMLRPGYNRPGTYTFLPITECPIAAPLLWRAAEALLPHLPPTHTGFEAELFTNHDQSQLQIQFFLPRPLDLPRLCTQLQHAVPELTGAGITLTGASGKQSRPGPVWGAAGLHYTVAGHDYWVSRGAFFQVNRFLVDTMVTLVDQAAEQAAAHATAGPLAWDLYAGVGLFSRALQARFPRVLGVETTGTDLRAVLKDDAVLLPTLDFLRTAVLQRDRPSFIVLDPPRAGLGPDVTALLARIAAPTLVYVSCDPASLARDLRPLLDSGYTVTALHLLDLFPQTSHLETVAILHR